MAIDEATLLEIERLKNEIKLKDMALDEEKKAYQKQLLGYCRQMKEELENPPKPSLILKWKVMWARWKKERSDRKILKAYKKRNSD